MGAINLTIQHIAGFFAVQSPLLVNRTWLLLLLVVVHRPTGSAASAAAAGLLRRSTGGGVAAAATAAGLLVWFRIRHRPRIGSYTLASVKVAYCGFAPKTGTLYWHVR